MLFMEQKNISIQDILGFSNVIKQAMESFADAHHKSMADMAERKSGALADAVEKI